ncbi:MAG: branched-chain amino acid transport system II carrier protein [Parachlamydiaceae bacterium]|nr:branched-chain amino acid transport system II carrier protein [Parachlamydiaceae bacterium]
MISSSKSRYISTGLAMFSMFFGAGNVIFPLVIGQMAGEKVPFSLLGLLVTAVGVPFMGMIAIILFRGNYQSFFDRMGKLPAAVIIACIMLLIGPFGGIPRCIALSYSTLKTSWDAFPFILFSLLACVIVFLFTYRKSRTLTLLGSVLTPLLLISLSVIIISGLMTPSELEPSSFSWLEAFKYGFLEGYNTMDLLASFFFSTIIFNGLKNYFDPKEADHDRSVFVHSIQSSIIGATLLSLIYIGFSYVAAYHAHALQITEQDQLLGSLTFKILGPYAGLFAAITIALACLTTAIALAVVFSEYLQKTVFDHRITYIQALLVTLVVTFGVSTLEFKGIVRLLAPILQIVYPALIVLTICNILYRLYHFKPVKVPVYITLGLAILYYI